MEIEVKCRGNARELRRRLVGKARYVQTVRQKDFLLDYPNAKLRKNDQLFRVREEYVLHGARWGETRVLVTYKGKKQKSKWVKRREEREEAVEAGVESVLEAAKDLGLHVHLNYEKIREQYEMRDAKVEIDFFPQHRELGTFVEIEAKSEKQIRKLMEELGLRKEDIEPKDYAHMVDEHLKKQEKTMGKEGAQKRRKKKKGGASKKIGKATNFKP